MSAVTFTPGVYYQHLCVPPNWTVFYIQDVENYPVAVPLGNEEFVLCAEIVRRTGGRGRGLYAKLLHKRGEHDVVLYHRVSKNHIGSGNWEEVNAMLCLALADVLP